MDDLVYSSFFELVNSVIEPGDPSEKGVTTLNNISVKLKDGELVDLNKSQWGVYLLNKEFPEALERLRVLSIKTLKRELELNEEQVVMCMAFMSRMTNIDTQDRLYDLDTKYKAVICRNTAVNRDRP